MTKSKLRDRHCELVPKGTPALNPKQIARYLGQTPGWKISNGELVRDLKFSNYFQTMSHVVAVAMLAQSEDHHPDLHVGYNKLQIRYSTHSVGGLSVNDFICAARINELLPKKSKS